jgi:UDP-glucose 4-epimerase
LLGRAHDLPALVVLDARGNGQEHATVARDDTPELAEGGFVAGALACGVDLVDVVVATDVLERRDAEDELERLILEREGAHVGHDAFDAGHIGLREIDARDLRAERNEAREVGGLRERVTDVEHARLAVVAGEKPRDLDRSLVARGRRTKLAWPRRPSDLARARALGGCEGDGTVEERDALELVARDELPQETRAGERAVAELLECGFASCVLGRAPHRKEPCALDELLVASRGGVEPALDAVAHGPDGTAARLVAVLSGKRIFITGGAGFIATTLARTLVDANEIIALDNLHRDALSATDLADHANFEFHQADVLDADAVRELAAGATHIVHCAAIAGVDTVLESPVRTMRVNLIGTYNVLEAAVATQSTLERLIDFSTSEVFGTHAYNVKEGHVSTIGSVGEARWTYAVSKLAGEHLAHAYHDELGIPTVTVRPFNVYGPGQIGGGAIRAFIEAALRGDNLTVRGDGAQIRAWCFVDDMVECVRLCLEHPKAIGQSYNVGNPRSAVTIFDLAQRVKRLTGCPGDIVFAPLEYVDVELRIPNVEKAREDIGFDAKVELDDGLERTIAWYRARKPALT